MGNAPLTPGEEQDPQPTAPVIDYSPASVPYDEAFENQLMRAILYPSETAPPPNPPHSPPLINPTTLPVPLNSHLRTHPSPIPGVRLTHANGYHTGGPGPSPSTVEAFAKQFIEEHGIEDVGHLDRVVEQKIAEKMELVRERMREREEAVQKDEAVRRALENLDVQRGVELRIAEKIKEGKRGG
ncbi:hypothetical protein BDV95DRAFT_485368 [Massariosphaeria phaeospora]|uniref:Uncharacterized protein n=1 Tax=Massariosphaeria phaeospora TaxID=100035 RepID=A0A7C8MCZ3_9PLEO|nr:hypothetical protein BDV95DRAFT_485368 [Massariosphaeria phaeospora]